MAALFLPAVVALIGCGTTTQTVRTVTVGTPEATSASHHSSHHARHTRRASTARRASRFVACDPNIQAKAATTTCRFAENAFYEYWLSDDASTIDVYSPAAGQSFTTRCSGFEHIVCRASDGGVAKFTQAALDNYDASQAADYAANHDVGANDSGASKQPDSGGAGSSSSSSSASDDGTFCDTHDCIPNFPNGNGSIVECADGTYSHSGGIQGACSHHGGEL